MKTVGVDIGAARRGHAAVLLGVSLQARALGRALTGIQVVKTISEHRPDLVAIDGPPRPGLRGRSRACERELARVGIHSYPTPSDPTVIDGNAFFAWMKASFALFDALASNYPLYLGGVTRGTVMEVFPHASAYILGGGPEPHGSKAAHRRSLLTGAGIDTSELKGADDVDAALAAYTGLLALNGQYRAIGDPEEGVIVLPAVARRSSSR